MTPIKALAFAVALSVSAVGVTACNTTSQATAQLDAAKGLYIAELAYQGFASSIIAAHDSGVLTGDRLTQAKAAEAQAYTALQLARQGRGSASQVITALNAGKAFVPAGQ